MDGDQRTKDRSLQRSYEGSRVEDELWVLAYERLWPLMRRPLTRRHEPPVRRSAPAPAALAKGA